MPDKSDKIEKDYSKEPKITKEQYLEYAKATEKEQPDYKFVKRRNGNGPHINLQQLVDIMIFFRFGVPKRVYDLMPETVKAFFVYDPNYRDEDDLFGLKDKPNV